MLLSAAPLWGCTSDPSSNTYEMVSPRDVGQKLDARSDLGVPDSGSPDLSVILDSGAVEIDAGAVPQSIYTCPDTVDTPTLCLTGGLDQGGTNFELKIVLLLPATCPEVEQIWAHLETSHKFTFQPMNNHSTGCAFYNPLPNDGGIEWGLIDDSVAPGCISGYSAGLVDTIVLSHGNNREIRKGVKLTVSKVNIGGSQTNPDCWGDGGLSIVVGEPR